MARTRRRAGQKVESSALAEPVSFVLAVEAVVTIDGHAWTRRRGTRRSPAADSNVAYLADWRTTAVSEDAQRAALSAALQDHIQRGLAPYLAGRSDGIAIAGYTLRIRPQNGRNPAWWGQSS